METTGIAPISSCLQGRHSTLKLWLHKLNHLTRSESHENLRGMNPTSWLLLHTLLFETIEGWTGLAPALRLDFVFKTNASTIPPPTLIELNLPFDHVWAPVKSVCYVKHTHDSSRTRHDVVSFLIDVPIKLVALSKRKHSNPPLRHAVTNDDDNVSIPDNEALEQSVANAEPTLQFAYTKNNDAVLAPLSNDGHVVHSIQVWVKSPIHFSTLIPSSRHVDSIWIVPAYLLA